MKHLTVISIASAICYPSCVAAAATTCLPLTLGGNIGRFTGLCATTPGTISSDGRDDVCLLAECCSNPGLIVIELPSGYYFPCYYANCNSICQLSQMRSTLGNEACLSTCTPPPPPTQQTDSCIKVFLDGIAQILPGVDLPNAGAECGHDLVGFSNSASYENCYAGCSCTKEGRQCEVQNDACGLGCGRALIPQSCVDFITGVTWALIIGLGGEAVVAIDILHHINDLYHFFDDALKCITSPNPI